MPPLLLQLYCPLQQITWRVHKERECTAVCKHALSKGEYLVLQHRYKETPHIYKHITGIHFIDTEL